MGGMVGGSLPPAENRNTEFTAQDLALKNLIGLLPGDTLEVVLFSQQSDETRFHYRSEPDRPTLPPIIHLRGGSAEMLSDGEDWLPFYEQLFQSLPEDIQKKITANALLPQELQDTELNELSSYLTNLAQIASALQTEGGEALTQIQGELQAEFVLLPFIAARGAVSTGNQVLETLQLSETAFTPEQTRVMQTLQYALGALNTLREQIEQGGLTEELLGQLEGLSNTLEQFSHEPKGEGMTLAHATLGTLSVVVNTMLSQTPSLALSSAMLASGNGGLIDPELLDGMDTLFSLIDQHYPTGVEGELAQLASIQEMVISEEGL